MSDGLEAAKFGGFPLIKDKNSSANRDRLKRLVLAKVLVARGYFVFGTKVFIFDKAVGFGNSIPRYRPDAPRPPYTVPIPIRIHGPRYGRATPGPECRVQNPLFWALGPLRWPTDVAHFNTFQWCKL